MYLRNSFNQVIDQIFTPIFSLRIKSRRRNRKDIGKWLNSKVEQEILNGQCSRRNVDRRG
jgi:hypothetical protein